MTFSSCIQLWLWLSAFATLAGWTLSVMGELNRTGYVVALIVFAIFILSLSKKFIPAIHFTLTAKTLHRFRRPLPFCFAALALLIFISGLIYAPDNYTGLTYRTGRVLQWLSHGHWVWVHTTDFRMNDRACGMEWMMASIILFTHSTRALFLLNYLPFLLLPGLIFSLFTRLGIHARVAWQWMWLLPTGYDFLLQAGSLANDTFPAIYALAAADYALRAAKSKNFSDLAYSILAAALLTGAKASNLPLLLTCAVLMIPLLPVLQKNIVSVIFVSLLAAAVSFLPTALLNIHYLGDWSGLSIEDTGMNMKNPFVGLWGNPFIFLLDNFTPPLFPMAEWWNHHASTLLPHFISAPIGNNFQDGSLALGEVPTEDWTGIGLGLSVLLAVSLGSHFFVPRNSSSRRLLTPFQWFVLVTPWLALLAYCAKSGMNTGARLIAPYYPLLIPLLLAGWAVPKIIRTRWWRALVYAALFLALIVLVLTPDRPLWPAKTILSGLVAKHPGSRALARAYDVYSVYAKRPDPLANVRALLPPSAERIGFIGTADDCDFSLWLPLGSRQVEHFLVSDPPERFQQLKVQYVVLGGLNLRYHQMTIDDWLNKNGAQLVNTTNAIQKVVEGFQPWYIVRLPDN